MGQIFDKIGNPIQLPPGAMFEVGTPTPLLLPRPSTTHLLSIYVHLLQQYCLSTFHLRPSTVAAAAASAAGLSAGADIRHDGQPYHAPARRYVRGVNTHTLDSRWTGQQ